MHNDNLYLFFTVMDMVSISKSDEHMGQYTCTARFCFMDFCPTDSFHRMDMDYVHQVNGGYCLKPNDFCCLKV